MGGQNLRKAKNGILDPPKTPPKGVETPRNSNHVNFMSYAPTQAPQIIFSARGLVKGILESSDSCGNRLLNLVIRRFLLYIVRAYFQNG